MFLNLFIYEFYEEIIMNIKEKGVRKSDPITLQGGGKRIKYYSMH